VMVVWVYLWMSLEMERPVCQCSIEGDHNEDQGCVPSAKR